MLGASIHVRSSVQEPPRVATRIIIMIIISDTEN